KLTPEQEIKESFRVVHNRERNIKDENVNNQAIIREFEEKTVYKNGRYEVNLPFKIENAWLGDNYATCKSRLRSLVQRSFKGDDKLLEQYDNIIRQQHFAGVIEKVNNYETIFDLKNDMKLVPSKQNPAGLGSIPRWN
ncbi:MAG: hypothetical protein AAFY76_14240, partial [Cyanobacteria bacterium J06649_11]